MVTLSKSLKKNVSFTFYISLIIMGCPNTVGALLVWFCFVLFVVRFVYIMTGFFNFRFASAAAETGGCDGQCKVHILCGFRLYSKAQFDQCTHPGDTGAAPTVLSPASLVASMLILVGLSV